MINGYRSPLMLYVHIPYCVHKCHYCDFNSHERMQPNWAAYQQALITELEHWANSPMYNGRKLSSLFFGGGTPSLAPPALIMSIIQTAERLLGFDQNIEITMEANPGTVDSSSFKGFHAAGVNRLSMGVQSLNEQELKWLERIHNSNEVIQAYKAARDAGFDNINLDLIYGLPEQSMDSWLQTLDAAIELSPEHLSCYQLTIEPHTKLAATHSKKPYPMPNEDLALEMFSETRNRLQLAGYQAYEISNFSKPGLKCRHNDGYWKYADYIGIGAGASGKWDIQLTDGTHRYSNIKSPEKYIEQTMSDGCAINSQEELNLDQAAAEAVWVGLRRTNGINRSEFKHRFGFDAFKHHKNIFQPWIKRKMLTYNKTSIFLTNNGLTMADAIAESVI